MKLKNKCKFGPFEGYQLRIQRRIQIDLGVSAPAAEVIMNLRNQVVELQAQIHQIELELAVQNENQNLRLVDNQQIFLEASWIELEMQG